MASDGDRTTAVFEAWRIGIVTKREDGRLRADGHIMARSDLVFPTVEQTPEVNDSAISQENASSIEESAAHLHRSPASIPAEIPSQKESA